MNFFLLDRLSTKILFLIAFAWYIVCCVSMFFLSNIYLILPFCTGIGFLLTSLTTLPYQMVSQFHLLNAESTTKKIKNGRERGVGTDCALLCSCYFLSQIIISLFMSHLLVRFGNRVILIVAAIFGMLGIILALFVVKFPKKKTLNCN
jgi:Na+/melibiose symporter-like transporter